MGRYAHRLNVGGVATKNLVEWVSSRNGSGAVRVHPRLKKSYLSGPSPYACNAAHTLWKAVITSST